MLSGALKRMFGPSVRPQKPYTFRFGLLCVHRSPKPFVTAVCAFTEILCHKYTTLFRISILFLQFFSTLKAYRRENCRHIVPYTLLYNRKGRRWEKIPATGD